MDTFTLWGHQRDCVPILKWSRLDNEVLRGKNALWLEKCCALSGLSLKAPSTLCCSAGWPGFGGSGGGVCMLPVVSIDADERGLSNWKTLVAQWSRGDEEEEGNAREVHGALKGGLVALPCRKRDGLGLGCDMVDEDKSAKRGEGTTSFRASSDDLCSREMSEFEKLSYLQIRDKWKQIIAFVACVIYNGKML